MTMPPASVSFATQPVGTALLLPHMQSLYHVPPDYSLLKVFGCKCYPNLRPYQTDKVSPKSVVCVFLGYSLNYKGYRCLDISNGRLYNSRHVTFVESSFPFTEISQTSGSPPIPISSPPLTISIPIPTPSTSTPPNSTYIRHYHSCSILRLLNLHPLIPTTDPSSLLPPPPPPPPQPTAIHSMVIRSQTGTSHDKQPLTLLTTKHPIPHALTAVVASLQPDPTTYKQATKYSHWDSAMNDE